MKSKSFLLGIFCVVSFVVISTFVTPSTFAQCPPDVSGTWVYRDVATDECCPDPSDNGRHRNKGSFEVTQVGNVISSSGVDEDGDSAVITGIVNGNSVYFKVEGTFLDDPGCGWVDHYVGIIKGNRIRGYSTEESTCNTCRAFYRSIVKIVK